MTTSGAAPAPEAEDRTAAASTTTSLWGRLQQPGPDGRALYQKRRFLLPLVAVLAFVLGNASAGSEADEIRAELAAAEEARQAAERAVTALEEQLADAEQRAASADERVAAAEGETADRVAEVEARAADAEARADDAEAAARTTLEAEYEQRRESLEAEIAERTEELDAREAQLDEREAAVTQLEEAAEMSTFGSGVWRVGEDVLAGQYRAADAADGCYWARLTADGEDIIDNHFSGESGPVVATIREGELFETNGCGQWERVG